LRRCGEEVSYARGRGSVSCGGRALRGRPDRRDDSAFPIRACHPTNPSVRYALDAAVPTRTNRAWRKHLATLTIRAPVGVGNGGNNTAGTTAVTGSTSTVAENPEPLWFTLAVACVAVGVIAGWALARPKWMPAPTVNEFALFYILAQGLERLAELISMFPAIGAVSQGGLTNRRSKATILAARDAAIGGARNALMNNNRVEATTKADQAAADHGDVNVARANRTVFLWGLNAGIASAACGAFGLCLLDLAGAAYVPRVVDIFLTGMAVGGGAKGLHELIANIQKAKETKEDTSATAGGG
jgi:hypothetical protein